MPQHPLARWPKASSRVRLGALQEGEAGEWEAVERSAWDCGNGWPVQEYDVVTLAPGERRAGSPACTSWEAWASGSTNGPRGSA